MAAATTVDIVDGSDLVQVDGMMSKTRIAYVTGVTGTNAEREYDALGVSGVPAMGDALGSSGELANCKVIRRSASPKSGQPNTIAVRCEYSTETTALAVASDADIPRYESSSIVTQKQSHTDYAGDPITTTYGTQTHGEFADALIPEITETMTRIENGIILITLQKAYVGKTNSAAWLDGDAGTWMCTGIHARSTDGAMNWEIVYQFAHRVGGWNPTVVYIDEATGKPPADLVVNVGYKTVTMYDTADFGTLNLL